jgi:hypothetical protein
MLIERKLQKKSILRKNKQQKFSTHLGKWQSEHKRKGEKLGMLSVAAEDQNFSRYCIKPIRPLLDCTNASRTQPFPLS